MRFPPLFDPSTELLLGFVSASCVSFRFSIQLKQKKNVVSVTHTHYTDATTDCCSSRNPHELYMEEHVECNAFAMCIFLLEFNGVRSNLTVAGGSLVTLSCEIAPGVVTTGDVPTYGEPSIFDICIPNCGSQWFLNTFRASSSLSSIRVPCKMEWNFDIEIGFGFSPALQFDNSMFLCF